MSLKIGVIGCGAIGKEHIKRLQFKLQNCEVVAVCDVFEDGAKSAAELFNVKKYYTDTNLLVNDSDVDAVVITSPGFAHKDAVLQAIAAKKPVFCEKPLATSAADCKEIVDAEMQANEHLVQVGFMRRYDIGYKQIKSLIDSNEFGDPLIVKCTHRNPSVDESYTTPMAVHDTAIHEIDVLHWLINDEYESAQVIMPKTTKHSHAKLKDPQMMILRTKTGILIEVEVFVNCKFGYDINCEVVCEEGVIHMPSPAFPTVRKDGYLKTAIEQSWINRFIDSYDVELQDWVDSAIKKEVNGPTAWDGYVAAVTADALVASQTSLKEEPILTGDMPSFYKG